MKYEIYLHNIQELEKVKNYIVPKWYEIYKKRFERGISCVIVDTPNLINGAELKAKNIIAVYELEYGKDYVEF